MYAALCLIMHDAECMFRSSIWTTSGLQVLLVQGLVLFVWNNVCIYIYIYILYRVGGTWPLLITKYTVFGHWWTPLDLLGYWRHHSMCYTGLFTTPPVDITISPYNESWPSDVLSRSGPGISSVLNAGSWLADCYKLTDYSLIKGLLAVWMILKFNSSVPNIEHLLARSTLPVLALSWISIIWLLKKRLSAVFVA
jgi:hypothetical protein